MQVLHNLCDAFLHRQLIGSEMNLGCFWCLIWCRDTSEVRDLSCASFLVQALGVALLGHLDWDIDEHLDEWDRVVSTVIRSSMEISCNLSISFVWRDEGCQGDC